MQVSLLIRNGKPDSSNHRGSLDIIADILESSRNEVNKTHLMYHCNLSFKQLKSYSHFLLKRGFLSEVAKKNGSNNGSLRVTDKGKKFLKAYKGVESLMH
jgi:predicted transcriptional regulator